MFLRLFLVLFPFLAFTQSKIYIIGKVEDFEKKKGIKAARIYNYNAKAGGTTNDRGAFFIWAMPGDSVSITAKGYNKRTFICQKITKDTTFYLISDPTYVTELDEVEVFGKKSEQMKREIKELLGEDPNTGKFNASSLLNGGSSVPGSVGAGVSIDAIYDYFSKSGKDHRKADYLTQQSRYKFYADWRLNRKLVNRLTGLIDKDLDNFMNYLMADKYMNTDYILRASDYELNATILTYYEAFKRKNSNIYFEK
jgi:CRISPR/Cas system-associated endoribonuclease Cas2